MKIKLQKPAYPVLIPVLAAPAFLFGAILAGLNWGALGFPQKQKNVINYSIIGTIVLLAAIIATPPEIIRKGWSIVLGINLGVGMALRKLQLPEYKKWQAREQVKLKK